MIAQTVSPAEQKIVELMQETKTKVIEYVTPVAASPSVVQAANQCIVNLDQAYMWFTVALRAAVHQVSPENVDKVAEEALRPKFGGTEGKKVDGGPVNG